MPDSNNIPNYDLFVKYFTRETNAREKNELENWVSVSTENRKAFDRMYFLWMQTANREVQEKIDTNLAWDKLQHRIKQPQAKLKIVPKEQNIYLRTAKNFLKVAAVLFLGYLINFIYENSKSEIQFVSKETSVDTANVLLADQTTVKLNKNSELSYPTAFKKEKRVVKLKGEAFFVVEPDKEKPFIIETAIAQIKVLGTSFNVKAYDTINKVSVSVETGSVELLNMLDKKQKLILTAGETGIIETESGEIYKEKNIIKNEAALYWLNKKLVFKETELYIVTETLSNIFNVEIILAGEEIKSCPLSAPFNNMSLDEILGVIATTFDLKIERSENKIILYGDGCI